MVHRNELNKKTNLDSKNKLMVTKRARERRVDTSGKRNQFYGEK